jgi:hypothetical protein
MTLMALVVVAAGGLLGSLRADIGYFFATERAVDLGDVGAVDPGALATNTFVRVQGTPMASGTVRFKRALTGEEFAVFPLAGQRTIFVQVPAGDPASERDLARREFAGRLVTFGDLGGRFGAVRGYLADAMGMPVSADSFLVLADEPPGSYGWALGLAALCLAFIVINGVLFVRWFRPLRA